MICACGVDFEPRNKNQKKCKKDCGRKSSSVNKARSSRRLNNELQFIAVDGEGVTREDGTHDYVLIGCGEDYYHNEDGSHLRWNKVFSFLWECFEKNPDAVYVGYFLGYDFTQWMRTLPYSRAKQLLTKEGIAKRQSTIINNPTPWPVRLGEWEFDIHAGKRFKLRKRGEEHWMYINDVGSYFQCSFLATIDPSQWEHPIVTQEEYEQIKRGKNKRDSAQLDFEMIEYMKMENRVLPRVMETLNRGLMSTEPPIKLTKMKWYGPGQAAQKWLDNIDAPRSDAVVEAVPPYALTAAQSSYYGGWFEIFAHGHIRGTSYEYDINSAYPAIIADLPCLLHGTWEHGYDDNPNVESGQLCLVHATIDGWDPNVGPVPYRDDKGHIYRPNRVSGWYWKHELEASGRADLIRSIEIDEWVRYTPCECLPPFSPIRELYLGRLRVNKNSPQGKAYKIVYNSSYGKMAQSIGNPRYANPVYASLITAGCRVKILDAIATHPHGTRDLLMVATDGVYFSTPHPNLDIDGKRLGAWEGKEKENLTLFMPGVYWDDSTRAKLRDGEDPKLRSRGVSGRDFAAKIFEIDRMFDNWFSEENGRVETYFETMEVWTPDTWPSVTIPIGFNMVTATQALARKSWPTCGMVYSNDVKDLTSWPGAKRNHTMVQKHIIHDYWVTSLYTFAEARETTPYDKSFGIELDELWADVGLTDDGPIDVSLRQMLD